MTRYLFGTELLRGREIFAIVVAQMVVADDRNRFQAGADQEINQHRFQLGLTGLEVVSADEHVRLFGQFDTSRNERVLRRTVDESTLFCFKYIIIMKTSQV